MSDRFGNVQRMTALVLLRLTPFPITSRTKGEASSVFQRFQYNSSDSRLCTAARASPNVATDCSKLYTSYVVGVSSSLTELRGPTLEYNRCNSPTVLQVTHSRKDSSSHTTGLIQRKPVSEYRHRKPAGIPHLPPRSQTSSPKSTSHTLKLHHAPNPSRPTKATTRVSSPTLIQRNLHLYRLTLRSICYAFTWAFSYYCGLCLFLLHTPFIFLVS
jgi:hypothetical protein